MWSFFGLLFFGGVTLFSVIGEQMSKNADKRYFQKKIGIAHSIAIDGGQDYDLVVKFKHNRELFVQELSEIDEDMIYIFGNDWRDIIYNEYRFSTLYASNPVGIAYHVYLSHKGYVAPRFPRYEAAGEDSYLRNLRGLRVIEKNMQKAHPDLNLKFIVCPCSSLDLTYKDDLRVCHVVWEHEVDKSNRAYVRRLRNLSDIEL